MSGRSSRIPIIAVSVVAVALLIAVIVLATRRCSSSSTINESMASSPCSSDVTNLFSDLDGLKIRWFPNFNSQSDLDSVLKGDYHIIELQVVLSRTDGAPTVSGSSQSLAQFLTSLQGASKGVKINMDTNRLAEAVIETLTAARFSGPTVISVPVMEQRVNGFTWSAFKKLIDESMLDPKTTTISFDMRARCCDKPIGVGVFEYIRSLVSTNTCFTYALEVDVESLSQDHWISLKSHLDVAPELTLLISGGNNITNTRASAFDILRVRNDMDSARVWYNIRGNLYEELLHLTSVGGSPLLYFDIQPRDASAIIWSHNTDTWDLLNAATQGNTMMIEGDIMLLGQDTPEQTDIPIMAHDKGENNNLTFEQWLDEIIKVEKGMKFDFKYIEAVVPSLNISLRKRSQIKGPIWINADILRGPGGPTPRVKSDELLSAASVLPGATLSLGWTTVQKGSIYNLKYTMAMVQEMHEVCKLISAPVTFPVRAEQLRNSLESFDWLLRQSRDYTLTVWTGHGDNVTKLDMDIAKERFEDSRVYFDLPVELRPSFGL